jgi:FdhE protein
MTTLNTTLKRYRNKFPHYLDFFELMQKIYYVRNDNEKLWTKEIFSIDKIAAEKKLNTGEPLINLQHDYFFDELPKQYFLDLLTIAEIEHPTLVQNLRESISNNKPFYTEMVQASFSQAGKKLADKPENPEEFAESFDLIPFFLQESLKPFFSCLALKLKDILTQNHWQQGICPVCSRPADLSLLREEEGIRSLFCVQCNFEWPYKRLRCHLCGNEDQDKLNYFTIDDPAQNHYRVNVCHQCQRFIKTIDTRITGNEIDLEIENLITIHLDMEAAREGFY